MDLLSGEKSACFANLFSSGSCLIIQKILIQKILYSRSSRIINKKIAGCALTINIATYTACMHAWCMCIKSMQMATQITDIELKQTQTLLVSRGAVCHIPYNRRVLTPFEPTWRF